MDNEFHSLYERAKIDKTFRTDIDEETLKRTIMHTMMATCMHYASGIVWAADNTKDYVEELNHLKKALLDFIKK